MLEKDPPLLLMVGTEYGGWVDWDGYIPHKHRHEKTLKLASTLYVAEGLCLNIEQIIVINSCIITILSLQFSIYRIHR